MTGSVQYRRLQIALVVVGVLFLLVYPVALFWPSGWIWHAGAPAASDYFLMIVGVYATLGVFLLNAARRPQDHLSLIWFTVCSSVVHAAIMAVQAVVGHHLGHLLGDVPALLAVAVIPGVAGARRRSAPARHNRPKRAVGPTAPGVRSCR